MGAIERADGHEPTREQEGAFHELAMCCASLRVSRMAPIGAGKYRATMLATDGSAMGALIVYPDGTALREYDERAA